MTYDSQVLKLYIDSKHKGSLVQPIKISGSNAGLARHWWSGGSITSTRFNGWIDEVKIYDKALTEEEIEKEFQGCDDKSFFYNEQPEDFNFAGDAEQADDLIVLTYPNIHTAGAVWHKNIVPVDYGFTADFSFMIEAGEGYDPIYEDVPGADGFAFVIQTRSPNFIGSLGGYLGYTEIDNAFSVEIDLYPNSEAPFNDPDESHLAIFGSKDKFHNYHGTDAEIARTSNFVPIDHSKLYDCTIKYDKLNYKLQIWLGEPHQKELVLELDDFDIREYMDLIDDHAAFVGITSSTGNAMQMHELYSFDFCIEPNDFINSVEEKEMNFYDFSIYPSPSSDRITIISDDSQIFTEFEIYDVMGKKLLAEYNKNEFEMNIDISSLSAGTYFIRAKIGNEYLNKKFVVLK
jgi:hypothetical protein